MLFMDIEHFKEGNPKPIGERFRRDSRMLPEGVSYLARWVDPEGARCFQLMETPDPELLDAWVRCRSDLVDFGIVPVVTSADFWSKHQIE